MNLFNNNVFTICLEGLRREQRKSFSENIKKMKAFFILCMISSLRSEPQLDLPKIHTTSPPSHDGRERPEVLVLPNSYTSEKHDTQRKSPPYDSIENDEYPVNQKIQERVRYDYIPTKFDSNRDNVKVTPNNDDYDIRNQQFPNHNYQNNFNNPYGGDAFNNGNGFQQNPYDAEYERKIRIETENLRKFLIEIDKKNSAECTLNVAAQWAFETNVNEVTQIDALAAQQRYSDYMRSIWEQIKLIDKTSLYDENLHRQLKLLASIGPSALPADQLDRYNRIINDMLAIYNSATICGYEQPFQCSLRLQPHLKEIMAKSRDWDELTWVWTEWRRKAGKPIRDLFEQLTDLTNEAANYNNYKDAAEYWSFQFDTPNFRYEMEDVWKEILPLYEQLHTYVRRKLREFYGPDKINRNAPLPAHILGNMYGQSWNILDITVPYPGRSNLDVTPAMRAQGYSPLIMFQLGEEFFTSMNMTAMPPEFWAHSIFEEPVDRPVLCQPSAWDFCNGADYRIKMCTDVTHKDFVTVHHELAHIQYFLNYHNNPKVFRDGANPGFHDAIGDAISLSITPKHLQGLGLIQKSIDDTAHEINFLFAMAMDKVVFLPYALALEQWRFDVFSKKVHKEQFNCHYWLLREKYGGIKPPVLRSELDFDPGAKYHVPANVPYMKYFFSTVFQFQLHRAMCIASKEFDPSNPSKPLHKCSIYRHHEAGHMLKKLMSKGASQPWQHTIQEVMGEGRLDGSAVREYFKPLEEWLRNENLRNQEYLGWNYDGDYCKKSIETANLQVFGGFYNDSTYASISTKGLISSIFLRFCFQFSFDYFYK
ncbi:CLUMA_CG009925, isoform A [Clunio marinus]|uniref:Angiotensin-converting enzyme n=1 Tax=Clunio marinus TaxID=568069 RepID=A0A1J1IC50_9DIPT|nr:CLUMA_CG009925, isoform A [Clunio marinus]